MYTQWNGFKEGTWQECIDVRNFIQKNYKLYEGDSSFLQGSTEKTKKVWDKAYSLIVKEVKKVLLM